MATSSDADVVLLDWHAPSDPRTIAPAHSTIVNDINCLRDCLMPTSVEFMGYKKKY